MKFDLRIWRQANADAPGDFVTYAVDGITPDTSFLEMLDSLNEQLTQRGEEPVAFDSDCREGICGMCSVVIDGRPHGPIPGTTTCQLYMRHFSDGDVITIEPWRSVAFPILRDLVVNRSALEELEGGFAKVALPVLRYVHEQRRNHREGSRKNIAEHYDLGNDFYRLWLDASLTYSAGVFENEGEGDFGGPFELRGAGEGE